MTEDVGENEGTWAARRGAAFALRVVIFLIPVVLSVLGTAVLSRGLPPPESTAVLIVYWVLLSIAATAILYMTDKAARQLLPLHALLNLSLIFPDRAPSRFKAALRTSSVRQLERRIAEVKANGLGDSETEAAETLVELVGALAHHDRLTRGHAERVRAYSRMIGEEMGLEDEAINKLTWAGLMHDVGKLYVPREILNKPGALTPEEFEIIKIHPGAGAELVEPLEDWLGDWLRAVGEHHERWDGDGYPNGLAAEEIAIGARIVAVADAFDVLTSARSYKSPSSAARARAEIQRCAGTQFDSTVVRAFLNISVGKFRMVMGPLSWLAQAPVVGVPVAPAVGALAAGFATAVGLLVGGQFQPPTVERAPAAVFAAPSPEPQVDAAVSTSSTSSTTTSSTTSTSTTTTSTTTSTTAPPAAAEAPPAPRTGETFFDDTFEAPAPEAADDVLNGVEDQSSIFAPLANDGEGLTLASVSQPSVGSVTPRLDSTVRFDPPPNWSGTTSFTYTAVDSNGTTTTASVTINYRSAPDAPQTQADWLIRAEDSGPSTIDVTANDSDADLQPLTVTGISRVPSSAPTIGTVSITSDDRIRFVPVANANGNDQFIYFVRDPDGLTASNLLTVTLTPVNDPPVARNDVGSMNEDTTKTFSVRSNDYDVDGGPLTTTSATSTDGTATTNGTTVTYRPAPNSFGTHRVTYTISDGRGGTDSAVLTVNVAPVNDPPVAANDVGSMNEDDPTKVFSVLGNDNDIDGGPISITTATSAFGTASTNGSTVSYQPNANGNGAHAVTYTISDGRGGTDTGTLTVNVAPVNDPPVFTGGGDDTVAEDVGPRTVPAWATLIGAGPIDEFGQALTFNVTAGDPTLFSSQPAVDPISGDLTYTPAPDANGITTITVTLSDSEGATTAPQTADIIITALNDAPTFTGGADDTVDEDAGPQIVPAWATDMRAGPPNESAQTVTFAVTADDPSLFSVQPAIDSTTGDLTYTPDPDANGTTTITVTLTDSSGATSPPQTADITITAVNDDPTFTAGADETIAEDSGPQTVTAWATAITAGPPNESAQTVAFTVTPDDATLFSVQPAIDPAGELTYTPGPDANGITTITVTLTDSAGATSAAQTADITITAVNDDPTFTAGPDELVAEDSGAQTVAGWATGIAAGPANESSQTVSFTVTPDDPALFGVQPAIDATTGDLTYTPAPDANGSTTLTITLTDSSGATSAAQTAGITITAVNDDPTFTAGPDELVAEDSGAQTVAGWATGIAAGPADESSQTITFTVTADDATLFSVQPAIDPTTGDLTYTPAPDANGSTTLTITLDDSAGATSAPQTADITISADNDAPTLDPIGAVGGAELTEITFTATATDPDLPDTLTFTLVGEPAGATIDPDFGVFTWTPTETEGPGSFTFDVVVSDDGVPQGDDTETITVTVAETNLAPSIDTAAGATVGTGQEIDLTPAMLAASDPDLPAQTLNFTLEVAPINGDVERTGTPLAQGATFTAAEIAAGDIAYEHDGSATTNDSFDITANDGVGGVSAPATFPITVAILSPTPITISEIRTDSQSGRDFVELYNGSYQEIDLGDENWTVVIEDRNGVVLETVALTGTFPINGYALITEAGYAGFGTPDATATIATFERGAGFSVRKAGVEIDAVGTSSGSSFAEGTPLPRMGGTLEQAYVRKNGWGRGACVDTDDNASDFVHQWALFASSPTGIADGFTSTCLGPAPPLPPPPPADHPVIREYRTDGPGGGNDEFIEIFNPGPDQDMTDWSVELNKPPFEVVHTFPDGFVLESGRHYLLAGAGYTGAATPDAPTDVGVTNGTGIVLWGVPGGRIDVLGIETGSEWYEPNVGVGLPRIDGQTYHSYERSNNGCTDTDNNFFDFEHHLGFDTPTNNSAGIFPCV